MRQYKKQYAEAIIIHIQHMLEVKEAQTLIEKPKYDGPGEPTNNHNDIKYRKKKKLFFHKERTNKS